MLAIPDRYRTYVYAVYATVGLILGSVAVGYSAAQMGQPVWLIVALAVYAYIGGSIGYTAATHVPAAPDAQLRALRTEVRVENHYPYVGEHRDSADRIEP